MYWWNYVDNFEQEEENLISSNRFQMLTVFYFGSFFCRCSLVSDLGIGYLATMSSLRVLSLRWCSIRDASVHHIISMKRLQYLSLAGKFISCVFCCYISSDYVFPFSTVNTHIEQLLYAVGFLLMWSDNHCESPVTLSSIHDALSKLRAFEQESTENLKINWAEMKLNLFLLFYLIFQQDVQASLHQPYALCLLYEI